MIDHTPVDGKVVARFTTTPDEMIEAVTTLSRVLYGYAGLSRAAGFWKRFVAFFMGSFLSSVLLVSANRFILGSGGFTLRDFNIAVISAGVAGFLVMFALSRFQMRRMRAALVKHPESEDVEIIAGATGIWWNTRKEKHFWIYSKFDHLITFKDGYYLVTGLSGGFIPGRGFDGESEKTAFEGLLQEKLPHAAVAQFFAAKARRSG